MVRPHTLALLVLAAVSRDAQAADWTKAGGGLFVGSAPVTQAPAPDEGPVRVPPLNQPYGEEIAKAAERHGLDPKLLGALVLVESGFRASAVSPAGAAGLTQLMPATAADLGVRDRFEPQENLNAGADYLARQLLRFGDLRLALAAYNSGPSRVARLGRVPEIAETKDYVAKVLDCFLALSAGRSVANTRQCRSMEKSR